MIYLKILMGSFVQCPRRGLVQDWTVEWDFFSSRVSVNIRVYRIWSVMFEEKYRENR